MGIIVASKFAGSATYNEGRDDSITLQPGENSITPAQLECLMNNLVFQSHRKNGYTAISSREDKPGVTDETSDSDAEEKSLKKPKK